MAQEGDAYELAQARLQKAIDALEHAVDMRVERDAVVDSVDAEIQRMTADRGRLARELDGALARGARLEEANRAVSQRLVDAMERVRAILDKQK